MESDRVKAERKEREAIEFHRRSAAASTRLEAVLLRFRAMWREETARLLRQRDW